MARPGLPDRPDPDDPAGIATLFFAFFDSSHFEECLATSFFEGQTFGDIHLCRLPRAKGQSHNPQRCSAPHSCLNAITGSIRLALRAGTKLANIAAATSNAIIATRVNGSMRLIPPTV
jgi:hypothetical protein